MLKNIKPQIVKAWSDYIGSGFINFKGRSGRVEYVTVFILNQFFPYLINFCVFGLVLLIQPPKAALESIVIFAFLTGMQIFYQASTISAGARRLHDLGYSGWWQLISLIAIILAVAGYMVYSESNGEGEVPLWLLGSVIVSGLVTLLMGLAMLFWPGQKIDNKFGKAIA